MSVRELITNSEKLDKDTIDKWHAVKPALLQNITHELTVETTMAVQYTGDLKALFTEIGIPPEYHYPTLIVNGFESYADFDGNPISVKVISEKIITKYQRGINQ